MQHSNFFKVKGALVSDFYQLAQQHIRVPNPFLGPKRFTMQAGITWLLMQTVLLGSGMALLYVGRRHLSSAMHRWAWPLLLWISIFLPTIRWWLPEQVLGAGLSHLFFAHVEWPPVVLRPAMLLGLGYLMGFAWRLARWLSQTPFHFALRQTAPATIRLSLWPPLPTWLMDVGGILLWFHPLALLCRKLWQRCMCAVTSTVTTSYFHLGAAIWALMAWTIVGYPPFRQAGAHYLDAPVVRLLSVPLLQLGTRAQSDTTPWHLQWGHLELPLAPAADGRLQGHHTVFASDWQRIRHETPRLWRGSTEVAVHHFQVTLWHQDLGTVQAMPWPQHVQSLSEPDEYGALVGWQLYLQAEGAVVHPLVVHVANPDALYYPPVPLPELPDTDERWPFQIVALPGYKTIVRLDTTAAPHLLKVYADTNRYELYDVPGFRTSRRFVGEQEDLFAATRIAVGTTLRPEIDHLHLNEWPYSPHAYVACCVGNLCAAPELSLIRPDSWHGHTWSVRIDDSRLDIVQAQLIVVQAGRRPRQYWLSGPQAPISFACLRQALPPPASFYLQNLVVRDAEGVLWHLPHTFAFHTAAPGMWHARLTPGIDPMPVLPLRADTVLTFSGTLRTLLLHACQVPANRLELPATLADTLLTCRLWLDKEALPAHRRILLETLRAAFSLHIARQWRRTDNHYALLTDEPSLLRRYTADNALDEELARVRALESPYFEPLGPLTLSELGSLLEARFGIYVSLWQPPSGKCYFALPLHDFQQTLVVLRQQYGLSLEQTFRPLQIVEVRVPSELSPPTLSTPR